MQKNTENLLPADIESVLSQNSPLLPSRELLSYVKHCFNLGSKYLEAIKGESMPLYIIDSSILRERADKFKKSFTKAFTDTAFYFAVKSNNHPDVARTLLQSGFGLDVSSGLELQMALDLGARDIVFSGPGKTKAELQMAVTNSDRVTILIDSFGELAKLQEIAAANNRVMRAGVRLTTGQETLWRKFGITLNDLPLFYEKAIDCVNIRFCGLQFHMSWNLTPDAQCNFIEMLGRTLASLPESHRKSIEFIDIGGGYWPSQGEWLQPAGTREGQLRMVVGRKAGRPTDHYRLPAAGVDEFAAQLSQAINRHIFAVIKCRICFEPGRWICHDAMHLLMSVADKKADDMIITDAGTNAIGWERFETDYFPVLNLTSPSLDERACNILGSLCTPHDVWGYTYWGESIKDGDILMIPSQGAYTFSLRQNFIKPLPPVVVL
ncbi:MAG: alanine racemase [Nitrospirae bacterium]|nr:alanine racemase [Nitrospirota bacterium]